MLLVILLIILLINLIIIKFIAFFESTFAFESNRNWNWISYYNIAEICLYFFKEYLRFRFNRGRRGLSRNGSRTTGTARLEIMSRSTFPLLPSLYHPSQPIDHSFLTSIARNFSRGLQMCLPFKLLRPGCSPCVKICSLPLPLPLKVGSIGDDWASTELNRWGS